MVKQAPTGEVRQPSSLTEGRSASKTSENRMPTVTRIATPELNRLIRSWQEAHPPPVRKNKRPHIIYSVQAETEPPTFILFVRGGDLAPDYLRFMERRLRETFDFVGTPVRVVARKRKRRET